MVIYSVTVTIHAIIEDEWYAWMQEEHIPAVMATECFLGYTMFRRTDPADISDRITYVIHYRCETQAMLHHYRDEYSSALQKEHAERYDGRFTASRLVLEEVD
jgi:Domain of unknown function (DUF4286)